MFRNHTFTCSNFTIPIVVTTIINEPMVDNKISNKEHVEHVNPSFTILDNRLESLKFLFANLPLTPHQIGIR
jgi:hypothetical protein